MNADDGAYKGYNILTSTEHDSTIGLWNGRYRIQDKGGKVVFESFVPPLKEEGESLEAANAEARAWIDGDTAKLSGTIE